MKDEILFMFCSFLQVSASFISVLISVSCISEDNIHGRPFLFNYCYAKKFIRNDKKRLKTGNNNDIL